MLFTMRSFPLLENQGQIKDNIITKEEGDINTVATSLRNMVTQLLHALLYNRAEFQLKLD